MRGEIRNSEVEPLVRVWRELASGREDEARQRLILVWTGYMDAVASRQSGRVALKLFERLAPVTDDPEYWARLPSQFTVYRAGPPGANWTLERRTADLLAREYGQTLISTGVVAKRDVLAYLTREDEIIARPENVSTTAIEELIHDEM